MMGRELIHMMLFVYSFFSQGAQGSLSSNLNSAEGLQVEVIDVWSFVMNPFARLALAALHVFSSAKSCVCLKI